MRDCAMLIFCVFVVAGLAGPIILDIAQGMREVRKELRLATTEQFKGKRP